MKHKSGAKLAFFDHAAPEDELQPLSDIRIKQKSLYSQILELERAIMHTGRGIMDDHLGYVPRDILSDEIWLHEDALRSSLALDRLKQLIESPMNAHGDLYKFWLDIPFVNQFPGNNLLLSAISRACHSVSDEHMLLVEEMVLILLSDAQSKLTPGYFKKLISFRYISSQAADSPSDYFFDNTPLTLAINSGLIKVASWILNTRLLTAKDINFQCGQGYIIKDRLNRIIKENPGLLSAAHLAALRLNVTRLDIDLSLIKLLIQQDADLSLRDAYGHTIPDLIKLVIPQFTPDCEIRRHEMGSEYAHRLEYDARLCDVYGQTDPFDQYNAKQRHPCLFLPPSHHDKTYPIEEILDVVVPTLQVDALPEIQKHEKPSSKGTLTASTHTLKTTLASHDIAAKLHARIT